jgi:hypothetical protein
MYYLYIKKHNKTNLSYLGYTNATDPHVYTGSGVYWLRHLKAHGYDFSTTILLATSDKKDLLDTAIFFSNLFKVVKSEHWANLKEETLDGGWDYVNTVINKTEARQKYFKEVGYQLGKSNKNTVSVKDSSGKIFRVSKEEYDKNSDLVGNTKGKSFLYDKEGNVIKAGTKENISGYHGNNYNKVFITNGILNKMILKSEQIPEGWHIGVSETKNKHNVGKMWVNNGEKEKMIIKTDELPEGWVRGRFKKIS